MSTDIFGVREHLVVDYRSFTAAFVEPSDERIGQFLVERLAAATVAQASSPPTAASGRLRVALRPTQGTGAVARVSCQRSLTGADGRPLT